MKHAWMTKAAQWTLIAGTAMAGTWAQAQGFVELPDEGPKVLKRCNPRNLASQDRCRVTSLPGEAGYTLVASRSGAIIKNDITVGTLFDRVYRKGGDYIFAMRAQLNANAYDLTGLSYNLNDLFRQLLEDQPAFIAYQMGPSTKALKKAGRTLQGLKEPDPEEEEEGPEATDAELDMAHHRQPTRDNGWVDFRIDANAAEVSGPSSASSPWLLLKTKAPAGYSVKQFAVRALSSDFPDRSQHVEIFLSGYQAN